IEAHFQESALDELRPESQRGTQAEHARIAAQYAARQPGDAALAAVVDELAEQEAPEPMALVIRAHENRKLRLAVIGVSGHARDPERLDRALSVRLLCDERHLPVVVDLGQARDLGVRELAKRREKARVQVFGRAARQKALVLREVLRTDGSQVQSAAVELHILLRVHGIRTD